jgi:hypothetical protein
VGSGKGDTLRRYIRHAELFGVALVYETAEDDLPVIELGYLVRHLRRVDPNWRLEKRQRATLMKRLLGADVPAKEVADIVGLSLGRVYQVRGNDTAEMS